MFDLNIEWKLEKRDANNAVVYSKVYGTTTNTLYVTGDAAPNELHTVLDIGCRKATGLIPDNGGGAGDQAIVSKVFEEFSDLIVNRVGEHATTTGMQYWGTVNGSNHAVAGLLLNGTGACQSWQALLYTILKDQGVGGIERRSIYPDSNYYASNAKHERLFLDELKVKSVTPVDIPTNGGRGGIRQLRLVSNFSGLT